MNSENLAKEHRTAHIEEKHILSTGERRIYSYYRCSNGKRVHQKLVNVSEQRIFSGFERALEAITITEAFAEEIAEALNETQRKARAATKRETDSYREALKALEQREDRIYDDFVKGLLDETGYKRQLEKIRAERSRFTNLLENANFAIQDAAMETAKSIIELAKHAKSLWLSQSPEARRGLLEKLLSNQVLDGPIVRYQLKKPFEILARMKETENWRPHRDSNPGFHRERVTS